jgi:hypothetical protein
MFDANRKASGFIFTYDDQPIRRPKTGWIGALRRAGLPHYRLHDLRHTFCSRLVEAGVIADIRKELLGHSRGGDVHSIYTHIDLPVLREAIHRLDQWHAEKMRSQGASENQRGGLALLDNRNEKPTESKEHPDDGNEHRNPAA